MRRVLLTLCAVAALLGAGTAVAAASPAGTVTPMTTYYQTWTVHKDQISYYTDKHTITVSGSNIYVKKTDGPGILVMFYKCSDRSVHGSWKRLQNDDPTPWVLIGTNFKVNTVFCLAVDDDQGNNDTDTWTGEIKWNVFSA